MPYPGHSLWGNVTPVQRCNQYILQPLPMRLYRCVSYNFRLVIFGETSDCESATLFHIRTWRIIKELQWRGFTSYQRRSVKRYFNQWFALLYLFLMAYQSLRIIQSHLCKSTVVVLLNPYAGGGGRIILFPSERSTMTRIRTNWLRGHSLAIRSEKLLSRTMKNILSNTKKYLVSSNYSYLLRSICLFS